MKKKDQQIYELALDNVYNANKKCIDYVNKNTDIDWILLYQTYINIEIDRLHTVEDE